jgi:molybdopterin-guanine dinucleotide biosynthesis protein MobB
MKIIQVSGRANSGKTTFINTLIPLLKPKGKTAVIKHLADHSFELDPGKDTTQFFETGAELSVGIDPKKSVIIVNCNTLDHTLNLFKLEGVDYAIIEGFKTRDFPKIIIGDLPSDSCVLRNPTPSEAIASLDLFEDY